MKRKIIKPTQFNVRNDSIIHIEKWDK